MPIRPVYEIHHFVLSCDACGVEFQCVNQGIDRLVRIAQDAGWQLEIEQGEWAQTYCPECGQRKRAREVLEG